MADWSKPSLTSNYANFVAEVKDRDVDAAVWFEGSSSTGIPTNSKRFNSTTHAFEKWNGTAWVAMDMTFTFPALTVTGAAAFNGNTTVGDSGSDTLTVNAAATFSGSATFNSNVTLGDAASDAVAVNGTMSFATAPVLTPGAGGGVVYLNGSKQLVAGSGMTFDGTTLLVSRNGGAATIDVNASEAASVSYFRLQDYGVTRAWFASYRDGTGKTELLGNGFLSFALGGSGSPSEQMRLTTAGLRIGAGAASQKLDVDGSAIFGNPGNTNAHVARFYNQNTNLYVGIDNASGSNTGIPNNNYFLGLNAHPMSFYTNASLRLQIDTSGNLLAADGVTGSWRVPRGTTAQRPTGAGGMIRFNIDLNKYEGHNGASWSSIGGGATGGSSDDIFYENGQTVTANYTITAGKNAMSAGPITIANGITVTVPFGSTWVIA